MENKKVCKSCSSQNLEKIIGIVESLISSCYSFGSSGNPQNVDEECEVETFKCLDCGRISAYTAKSRKNFEDIIQRLNEDYYLANNR